MKKVLYLSLSGMTESLGRSQVLEYLIDLSKTNEIYLISFERESDFENLEEIKILVKESGIKWKYFKYTNKYGIFTTIFQIISAVILASKLIKKESIDIIHSRSMIPATMAIILKKIHNIKHLFDIRGFVFDEKVDSGRLKKESFLFKILKKLEEVLYTHSDHIVTLTQKSKDIISIKYQISSDLISVIPTCANNQIFRLISSNEKKQLKKELGYDENDYIVIHTGTVTNSYDFETEVKIFKELNKRDPNIKFLIVNKGQHEFIENVFIKYSVKKDLYKVITSIFSQMYKYLNLADISLFIIPPTYSKQASSPTKFAENLLCNLPSVTNSGIGDMDYYLNNYNVGYLIDNKLLSDNFGLVVKLVYDYINFSKNEYNFDLLFNSYFNKVNAVKNYVKIYDKLIS